MAINTQTIRIDLNTGRTIPVAFAHQNDTNRQLTFQLYNNGVAFTPSSTTVKFAYKSPIVNGRYSVITGSQMASGTVSGNTVTVTLPAQYTQVSGVGLLTMILTTSGNTLRPVNIKFVCQGSADGDDTILNASDWPDGLYDYMDNWLAENEPTEIANLKSDLTPLVKEQKQKVTWSPGAYEASGYGALTSDKYKYSQKFPAGHYIVNPVEYLRSEIYTYVSDTEGTRLYGMTSTATRDFTTDSEFVITVARTDGTTLNGYEEYLNSFKPIKINDNSIESRLTYLENYQEIAFNDSYHLNSSDFIRARIDSSGATIADNSHRWASTQYPISYPFPITLTPLSGWQIKISYFNQDGSYSTADDWTTTGTTISANQKFKITIGEITTGSDDFSIDSWVSQVDVQSFYAKQIDKNESDILSLSNAISSISSGKTSLYDLQNGRMLKIKGINHRGYNTEAPENSIPAFKLSAQHGFNYVETDVQFTEDNVPVLIHNRRINNYARLSDGSELTTNQYVDQNTLAQLMEYDWGLYYGEEYSGLKIATFEEFVILCKKLGLHGYVEIKEVTVVFSQSNVENLVNIVDKYDMLDNITFISFSSTYLSYIKNVAPSARLGFIIDTVDASAIQTAQSLKTGSNEVFIDTAHYTTEQIALCVNANLPIEIYTIDNSDTILSLPTEIVGVTSNSLIAGRIIYNSNV